MKTTNFPALRVEQELRDEAESVLHENETLSSFQEEAIRYHIDRRNLNERFIEKAMTAREQAHARQEWHSAEEVLQELDFILKSSD